MSAARGGGVTAARWRGARVSRACAIGAVVIAVAASISGCGMVWTYNQAMDLRRSLYTFHFDPPDSVAYALPTPPPVYAAIFDGRYYVPPDPVVIPPSRAGGARSAILSGVADTMATPPLITLPPPPVQVDLSPAREAELRSRATRDMAAAEIAIRRFQETSRVGALEREQVQAARGLLHQATAALERRDFQGAANLAEKARVLADQLTAGQP